MLSLFQMVLLHSGTVFFSLFLGFLLSVVTNNKSKSLQFTVFAMEFSAGFSVSAVFLSIIPAAYSELKVYELILFLIAGIFTATVLQEKLKYKHRTMSQKNRLIATERLSVLSFVAQNFLRGTSVGTGFGLSTGLGHSLGITSALCIFTGSTAIFTMSKASKKTVLRRFIGCFSLFIPFLAGATAGIFLGSINRAWLFRMLLFSGGITLYSAIGDVNMESKLIYHGRLLPFFNISGILLGIAVILSG